VRESIAALDATALAAEWEKALEAPDWDGMPVWIHGDLDARNILVANGRISAVIDWGSAGVGDPACDVMVAWKLLDAEGRDTLRGLLGVDEATWARARGWVLSQALGALAYYTDETNPTLIGEARSWLRELRVDAHADGGDVA